MNWSTVVLMLSTVAFASTSIALWRRLESERDEHTAARARIVQLEQRVSSMAPAPTQARPQPQLAASIGQEVPRNASPPPAERPRLSPEANVMMLQPRDMLQDPEYRAAMEQRHRFGLQRTFSDVGSALQLSPGEVDELFDVLVDQAMRAIDGSQVFDVQTQQDPAEMQRHFEEQQRQREAELEGVLGNKLQAWKDYEMSLGARMQVRELRTLLADTTEPLRAHQAEALITALAAEDRQFVETMRSSFSPAHATRADPKALMKAHAEAQMQYLERRRAAATAHLTATQRRAFNELIDQQIADAKLQAKMMEMQPAIENGADGQFGPAPAALRAAP